MSLRSLFLAAVFLIAQQASWATSSSHDASGFLENFRNFYKDRFVGFMKMNVFSESLEEYNEPIYTGSKFEAIKKTIIYNNEAHHSVKQEPTDSVNLSFIKGNPLVFANPLQGRANFEAIRNLAQLQIGYNIALPPSEIAIKAIFVRVYGGGELHQPDDIYRSDKELLRKGVAVVTLNLTDTLPSIGHGNYSSLEQEQILQDSIHHFYEVISRTPEALHPSLSVLKNKSVFLYGASWGGGTVVIQATRYPGTFTGYISHDGGLVEGRRDHAPDKTEQIANIKDPVLIIHNFDDNNVSLKDGISWYQRALTAGKDSLVSFYMPMHANIIIPGTDEFQRGHGVSRGEQGVKDYAKALLFFMERVGQLNQSKLSQLRAHQGALKHGKYQVGLEFRNPSTDDIFISKAYTLYTKNPTKYDIELTWQEKYVPLYYQSFVQAMDNEKARDLLGNLSPTPEQLAKTLKKQLPNFLQFFKEMTQQPVTLSIQDLSQDPELQTSLKERFKSCSFVCSRVLKLYYEGNPLLGSSIATEANFTTEKQEILKTRLKEAIEKEKWLKRTIIEDAAHQMILSKRVRDRLKAAVETRRTANTRTSGN